MCMEMAMEKKKGVGISNKKLEKTRRERIRIGTWNVRQIQRKEAELTEKIEKYEVAILGLAVTKKKGKGMERIHNNHVSIFIVE